MPQKSAEWSLSLRLAPDARSISSTAAAWVPGGMAVEVHPATGRLVFAAYLFLRGNGNAQTIGPTPEPSQKR